MERCSKWLIAISLAGLLSSGCMPAGPRSLLEGERLIRKGHYVLAIQQLKGAVQLLPENAQAWNHLGLAYHGAGQWTNAIRAYDHALVLSNNLAAARYNLGCVHLDQNNPSAAIEEFKRFTLLQSTSAEGWLKLATAQLAARQVDAAEHGYYQALKISPYHPEALNGLGMIQVERKRVREAFQSFATALSQHPGYAPALLNQAIVAHLYLNDRPLALQKYSEYLALRPRPGNTLAVERVARQLQIELNPPPRQAANIVGSSNIATNALMPRTDSPIANQSVPASPAPVTARSNLPTSSPAITSRANNPTLGGMPDTPRTNAVESPPRLQVVRLPNEITQKPPEAAIGSAPSDAPRAPEPTPNRGVEAAPRNEKPGALNRMNPTTWFRSNSKSGPSITPLSPVASPAVVKPDIKGNDRPAPSKGLPVPEKASIPRYSYAPPSQLQPGNRSKAETFFSQAVQDHKRRRLAAAIEGYQAATHADPNFFEAYYDLGLAAYESGDLPLSLTAYEHALTLNSTHVSSRYNFALALQQANYLLDAANELEKLLAQSPGEARAHLALANLYALHLDRPALARAHYLEVLAKDPNSSQATAIRYWLADHPSP
jgi:tetratricopeptide (TPR) repeat protein